MVLQIVLQGAVDEFNIKIGLLSFWAPYLINFNYTEDSTVPRGLGKASAEEIKKSAIYITKLFPAITSEEVRRKLIDGSLPDQALNYKGIDCSGFIYHVMTRIYDEVLGKELMDDLSVPRSHVLNGAYNLEEWKAAHALSKNEAAELPEDVPMRWVVETFKRQPVNLCRVAGLVSDYSSTTVPIKDMRVGDLVELAGRAGYKDHVAIIYKLNNEGVEIAHSGRKNPEDVGGVKIELLKYDEKQIYTAEMAVPRDFISVRRLKSLA